MALFASVLIVILLAIAGFSWMVARLVRPAGSGAVSLEWLDEFAIEKYAPMERLLCEMDYAFLSQQRGFEPAIAKRLMHERKKIFREYLRLLRIDFQRLVALADIMIVQSQNDQASLVTEVWRQRRLFYWNLTVLEIRFLVAPFGAQVSGIKEVLAAVEAMRICVNEMTPAALQAA
jgi:sporulation protein YlmC with PRC-barrel domain